ncbi:hypothetical protein COOONC_06287 [Cooperia oncophora]
MKKNYDRGKKERKFSVGQEVFIRNYTGSGDRWIPGIVVKVLGSSTYEVHFGMGVRKTHADQMKERVIPWELVDEGWLAKRDRRVPVQAGEPTERMTLRRSQRKRQATARMKEFQENEKRRKINWIRMLRNEDENKNENYHREVYKRREEEFDIPPTHKKPLKKPYKKPHETPQKPLKKPLKKPHKKPHETPQKPHEKPREKPEPTAAQRAAKS